MATPVAVTAEGSTRDADHRPAVYREDGKWVFRASMFGACEQALVREALGQVPSPPPQAIRDAYAEGVAREAEVVAALPRWGWLAMAPERCGDYGKVDGTGQVVCDLAVGPGAVIRVHPDAIAQCFKSTVGAGEGYRVRDRRWVEVKVLAEGSLPDPLAKPQYAWQVSCQAAATGLPGLFVVGRKAGKVGGVEGGGPRELSSIGEEWVDKPPHSLGEVKARARRLVKLIEAAEGGEVPACDWAMWPCGFWHAHDTSEGSVHHRGEGVLGDEDERHAKAWVFKWRVAKKMRESWAGKEQEARDALAGLLEAAGVVRWQGAGAAVAYCPGAIRERFDVKAAQRDGVEVGKYMAESKVRAYVKVTDEEAKEGVRDAAVGTG